MSESIVNQLVRIMEKRRIKVPRLAEILEIPKDRIYKWIQLGSHPKEEDAIKVRKWIEYGNNYTNIEDLTLNDINAAVLYAKKSPLYTKTSEEWAVIRLLISEIASMQSKITNQAFQDCLDELHNKVEIILQPM